MKKRNIQPRLIVCALSLVLAGTSSAQSISRSQLGSSFEIRYGSVETVKRVKIKSQAAQGAVMGGLIGGATSGKNRRGKHAVEGAIAGALLVALLEGNKKAYQYTVELDDGRVTKITTEAGGIEEGDCVALELGRTANIRRTSAVNCDFGGHPALDEPIVRVKRQTDAAECQTAKDLAMKATTQEKLEIAVKKVRIFCEG